MIRAAEPAVERAWKRERAERLLQSACEWLSRLGRAQGVKLSASWQRDGAPAEAAAAGGAQLGGSAAALGQPRAAVLAASPASFQPSKAANTIGSLRVGFWSQWR